MTSNIMNPYRWLSIRSKKSNQEKDVTPNITNLDEGLTPVLGWIFWMKGACTYLLACNN